MLLEIVENDVLTLVPSARTEASPIRISMPSKIEYSTSVAPSWPDPRLTVFIRIPYTILREAQ